MTRLERCQLAKEKGYTYEPKTGNIYGPTNILITSKKGEGYIKFNMRIGTKRIEVCGHHFAWYMTYDNVDFEQIDHINRNESDNRISNLRSVNQNQNQWNKDVKGYWWCEYNKKWRSVIRYNHIRKHLGYFNTEEEARQAYLNAKEKYHII